MSLRVFLARTPQGWQVMQGGFARIGSAPEPSAIAMQRGGTAADVWVVSPRRSRPSPCCRPRPPYARVRRGVLPSRAGDNLYWLGRYVERAEGAMRLMRAYHVRLAETADPRRAAARDLADYLERLGIDPPSVVPPALIAHARQRDRQRRQRPRPLLHRRLDGAERPRQDRPPPWPSASSPGDDAARAMGVLLRKITGFSGLVHENMYRFTGWRFLSIGRSLERAIAMARRSPGSPTPTRPTARSTSRSRSATASCPTAAATPSPPPARPWSTCSPSTA